jgi:hypothetical protein
MLWDDTFRSWVELGVRSQPAAVLYAADGASLRSWTGPFDEAEVVRLIGG